MSDLVVDPSAVGAAATEISRCASRLMALELTSHAGLEGATSTFSQLAGQFKGATSDMSAVAATADRKISASLANASGAVSAFSELVVGVKNTTVDTDAQNAGRLRDTVPYPTRQGQQTDRPVPIDVLLSVK
ncbi:hypothetical protein [Gordonia hankookensis]|uniref:ESX-1 secretion-associated protein n=1 Tax=Gordonia hankookensis TaxID=589403 RepID=A0ABR7WAV0_9ACTN|nr:hypothetical protein [Gordonia hankookensis]MBD1319928.1 hypothetical protein [Gordonia hankookensis]